MRINLASILVDDQDKALQFLHRRLGLREEYSSAELQSAKAVGRDQANHKLSTPAPVIL